MSESDVSENSESTIEPFVFERVLESLKTAATETLESKDYLSYSTLLDIYLGEPAKYTYDEREELLSALLSILSANPGLTYEIGWDLPGLLILYVDSDFDFTGGLRKAPCVYKILKIFEVLAINGNPKELFLKSCELLTTISADDSQVTDDSSIKEKFFDVKLYCIFELVDSCFKRIKTYYPSRFLAMTVASFINLAHKNGNDSPNNISFIMKRAYTFARNYSSPPLPDSDGDKMSPEDLSKIKEDEEYLQRKLLTGFISQLIQLMSNDNLNGYTLDHLSFLQVPHRGQLKKYFEYSVNLPVMDRLAELALSYDINLTQHFKSMVADSHTLLRSFDYSIDRDELSAQIFEKVVVDYQKTLAMSIINSDAKEIRDSPLGIFLLYTHAISVRRTFDLIKVSFSDAVVLTLRVLVPELVQSTFVFKGVEDATIFWTWYALYQTSLNNKSVETEIAAISPVLLTIYYQVIFFVVITNSNRPNFKYAVLTLLTRVLALSPEDLSYDFVKDSLHNCPYESEKPIMIGVLKELLTKDKSSSTSDVTEALANSEDSKVPLPPTLPPRASSASSRYFTLTKARLEDILALVQEAVDSAFVTHESTVAIDPSKLSTLSAYLNLLVIIKKDPVVLQDKKALDKVVESAEENIAAVKEKHKKYPNSNKFELNAAGILEITIDRIKS
ncbi:YAP1 binding protein 2 (YBP2) [Scheffersomyces stipitis CBS 6054]|uniref:YAP1 binding protein 2 (YBP2) n=1 Tax=Scheffersomyces stipitis (strain ATCC 58785 / CBS 6054 / NBRC 10063 / NRRL Y-11545) TaxID=322104 RepID=A3GI32_PICST|nr:YAP1 binding protein 2 (YBP2) [Scheffersomyces stipitis CBS 6054]EAZ62918.2 YAP1 binding protein 2 (YBP2) [Scheffersomyces stipitis CBS 6054]